MTRARVTTAINLLAYVGIACISVAAVLTVVDICLRHSIGSPIRGLVDLTQLSMMYAVFLSIAYGFARKAHVAITLLTEPLPGKARRTLAGFWWAVAFVLLALLSYAAFFQAADIYSYGDVSQNLRIPMILYWLPVVAGLGLSAVCSLWGMLDEFVNIDTLQTES